MAKTVINEEDLIEKKVDAMVKIADKQVTTIKNGEKSINPKQNIYSTPLDQLRINGYVNWLLY